MVGYPHDIKGQGIYAYVTLMAGEAPSDELKKELVGWVRKEIGAIAAPDLIQFAPGLPKTRSGKIMRRILRKIAEDDFSNLGDTSTLADPAVVDDLVTNRQNRRPPRISFTALANGVAGPALTGNRATSRCRISTLFTLLLKHAFSVAAIRLFSRPNRAEMRPDSGNGNDIMRLALAFSIAASVDGLDLCGRKPSRGARRP